MPSVGIYSYELYHFYDVENIIRIGSAGAMQDDVNVMDIVIAMGACTNSNYGDQYQIPGTFAPIADYELLDRAVQAARKKGANVKVGNVLSSDVFYHDREDFNDRFRRMGVLAVEMEAAALYMTAAKLGKRALAICSISDSLVTGEELSPSQRQTTFTTMMRIALDTAVRLSGK